VPDVIALGMLLVLIGFALVVSRGGIPGSAAARNVSLGMQRVFKTPGYQGIASRRYRLFQIAAGLVLIAGGMALIASWG
jgi:hypothetical protein